MFAPSTPIEVRIVSALLAIVARWFAERPRAVPIASGTFREFDRAFRRDRDARAGYAGLLAADLID